MPDLIELLVANAGVRGAQVGSAVEGPQHADVGVVG